MTGAIIAASILIALGLLVLMTHLALLPVEWLLEFFGVGSIDAASATAQCLTGAGLALLVLGPLFGPSGALEWATVGVSAAALGVVAAWLGSRLSPDDDPGGLQ